MSLGSRGHSHAQFQLSIQTTNKTSSQMLICNGFVDTLTLCNFSKGLCLNVHNEVKLGKAAGFAPAGVRVICRRWSCR